MDFDKTAEIVCFNVLSKEDRDECESAARYALKEAYNAGLEDAAKVAEDYEIKTKSSKEIAERIKKLEKSSGY